MADQSSGVTIFPDLSVINVTVTSGVGNVTDMLMSVSPALVMTRYIVQKVLVPVMVTVGVLGNILNVVVLRHPSLRSSTNVYLLMLSATDTVYLILSFALSFALCDSPSQPRAVFYLIPYGRPLSDLAGNFGVWLTVIFTVERYVAVSYPMRGKMWCTVSKAKVFSLLAFVFCLVNTLPEVFELEIVETDNNRLHCSYSNFSQTHTYQMGYYWWYVSIFAFVPFVFLIIFNSLLIKMVLRARRRRFKMTSMPSRSTTSTPARSATCSLIGSFKEPKANPKPRLNEQNKITLLLVTIVIVFLLCQIPWTVLLLYRVYLSANRLPEPRNDIKIAGNVCNLLVLVNASVNFYLYSFFSVRFRHALTSTLFFWKWKLSRDKETIISL